MKVTILLFCVLYFSCSNSQTNISNELYQQNFDLPTFTLEEAGFKKDSIDNIINLIHETPHKDLRGLIVIKDGHIVIEEYFNTFWRNSIHDIRSAGKSVTALLLGIAIKEGLIKSLEQDVYSLFSKIKNPSINKDYKKIKLKHLLDMSSGLDADSDNPSSIGQAGNWIAKDDWKEYLLNVPLISSPGETFVYADINPLLIGLAIEEASGMSLKDYAKEKLFAPLGIQQYYWYTNGANQTGAAGNLYITALDFAKLGMLIINEGQWHKQQIIDPDYINLVINSKNTAISVSWPWVDSYGMFWYKKAGVFNGKKLNYIYGSGLGGNHLIVLPKEKLVIAITSSAYGQPYQHGRSYAIMEKMFNAIK